MNIKFWKSKNFWKSSYNRYEDGAIFLSIVAPFFILLYILNGYCLFFVEYFNLAETFPIFRNARFSNLFIHSILMIFLMIWIVIVGLFFKWRRDKRESNR